MRIKRTRGLKRLARRVERWRIKVLSAAFTEISYTDRHYAEILVHPWSGLTLTNSKIAEPRGKIKLQMLSALVDIYDSWKHQLDSTGKPYYLKLWLFEPRFSKSQVVCAIGDSVAYYENTFDNPATGRVLNLAQHGRLAQQLGELNWQGYVDEDCYTNDDVGEPQQYRSLKEYEESVHWFKRLLTKPHRSEKPQQAVGHITGLYLFKRGYVWVGEKK